MLTNCSTIDGHKMVHSVHNLNHEGTVTILYYKEYIKEVNNIFHNNYGITFYDFINNLRIKEAKIKLLDPKYDVFTIESIGLEAGFGSRSNFYEIFKKQTGKTPSEYKLQRKVISS